MPPSAPSPLDLRLAQALVQRGLVRQEALAALHAQGVARGLEHRGSVLLGAALAGGQLSMAAADELLAAVGDAEGESEIAAPEASEVPPLERALGQLLVHRRLIQPPDLPGLFERARARGERHGGSLLCAAALREGLLTQATADLLLRSLASAGPGSTAATPSAAEADALTGRVLADDDPSDADGLIQRALDGATPRAGPNARRQPVRLAAPPPQPAPPAPAPSPLPAGPSLPGGFGLGPGGGFGMEPAPAPADPALAPTLTGQPEHAPTLPGPGPGGAPPVGADAGATMLESPPELPHASRSGPDSTRWDGPGADAAVTRWERPAEGAGGAGARAPATEAGVPQPAAIRRGRVSATARRGSAQGFLEEVFQGDRYELRPRSGLPGELPALDRRLRREVVLHLPPTPVRGPGEAERFLREAHLLAQLDHAAIPRVHDIGLREGTPYFTTDPLPGERLSELPDAGQPLRLPALLRAFLRVVAAVEHAHRVGLAHGELGPEHVVLGELGQVWVAGWGRAVALPSASPALVAAARAPVLVPNLGAPSHMAPEVRAGRAVVARTDVWGLGAILLWILARRRPEARGDAVRGVVGLPPELLAIARRALAGSPHGRYPSAGALLEDVRAFLDGRPVSAAPESAWGTLRRLARHHPLAAAVAGGGAAALLLIGGFTFRSVHGDWRRAAISAATAREELARGERLRQLAQLRLQAARERGTGEQELSGARGEVGRSDRAVLAGFAAAEAAANQAAAKDDEAARLARGLGEPESASAPAQELARRAARLRGEWVLRSASPDASGGVPLEQALADWGALCAADPRDAEAQLGRFQAARRLPSAAAGREERAALDALAELEGPLAELARAEQVRRAAEADDRTDPGALDEALRRVDDAIAARPDLALGYELRGRLRLLRAGPGHAGRKREGKLLEPGLGDLLHASRLDPRDPFPRLALLREWNEAYGLHAPWRFEVGSWVGGLEAAAALTPRIQPPLELASYLQLLDAAEESLPVLERALRRPVAEPRPEEGGLRAELALLHARALLAARRPAGEALQALPEQLPPELEAQARMLRAHQTLIEQGGEPAAAALREALQVLQGPVGGAALNDLIAALADERVDARAALSVLGRLPLPPPRDPSAAGMAPLIAAVLHAGARGGVPPQSLDPLLQWLSSAGTFVWAQPRPGLGPARLGYARLVLAHQPENPDAGFWPLVVWASINHLFPTPPALAAEAQALLRQRARKLGLPEASWETGDPAATPADEVWVRRAWESQPEAPR